MLVVAMLCRLVGMQCRLVGMACGAKKDPRAKLG